MHLTLRCNLNNADIAKLKKAEVFIIS